MARLSIAIALGAALIACGGAASTHDASAAPARAQRTHRQTPLVIASVVNQTSAAKSESELREDLADALDSASFDGMPADKRFLISATLMELEKERAGSTAVTTSTIEIAVVEGKSGKIIGVVRGHGRVEAAAGDDGADEDAVKAAAKGAVDSAVEMARLPGH